MSDRIPAARKSPESKRFSMAAKGATALAVDEIVYVTGTSDAYLEVTKADADAAVSSSGPLFLVRTPSDVSGLVVDVRVVEVASFGIVDNVDTSAATVGDPVFLSGTAGGWTLTNPAGFHRIVGYVTKVHASTGEWVFCPQPESIKKGVGRIVVASEAAVSGVAVFSTTDLGGNYDGKPVAVGKTNDSYTILGYAWDGSGQLTVTLSNSASTATVTVFVAIDGV